MRTRSVTIYDLDEASLDSSATNAAEPSPSPSEAAGSPPHSLILSIRKPHCSQHSPSTKSSSPENKQLVKLQRTHAELWQENETSIVLKQLDDSLRQNDGSRLHALQRSLLEIERRSDKESSSDLEDFKDFALTPPAIITRRESATLEPVEHRTGSERTACSSSLIVLGKGGDQEFSPREQEYLQKAIKQNVKRYDVQFNVLLVGDSLTGKTSVMRTMIGSKFSTHTPRSTGLDSRILYREHKGKKVKFKLIDTDADRSKEFIRKVYYDMSNVVVLLYDVTNQESFNNTRFWCDSIRSQSARCPLIFLVGNKVDDKSHRQVSGKLAAQFAKQGKMHFAEISAKDPDSVLRLLSKITAYLLEGCTEPKEQSRMAAEKGCVGCVIA